MKRAAQAQAMAGKDPGGATEALRQARSLAPEAIQLGWGLGRLLASAGQIEEAIEVLESSLAAAEWSDWEYRMRARLLLAELYAKAGRSRQAILQYRHVLAGSVRSELIRKARLALAQLQE